jgi:ribose transport system substrate-binding protein
MKNRYRHRAVLGAVLVLTVATAIGATVASAGRTAKPGAGITIGYAGLSSQFSFVAAVNKGLAQAAKKAGAKLVILDNKYDPQVALTNADTLVNRHVNVVIEFQTDQSIAPALCQKFKAAGLGDKVIAIDIPHPPCSKFFGANNHLSGVIAGQETAKLAKKQWGSIGKVVVLELPQSGKLVLSRTQGFVDGVKKVFPNLKKSDVIKLDGKGTTEGSLNAFQSELARLTGTHHVLVGGVNDDSTIGALRAIEAAGRQSDFLIGGEGANLPSAIQEICNNSKTYVGTVAYFPERYGQALVPLAIKLAKGQKIPQWNYIHHVWIDHANISKYYKCK